MTLSFFWQLFRIALFISGAFCLFYGISGCFGFTALFAGLTGAGIASIFMAFLTKPIDPKDTEDQ